MTDEEILNELLGSKEWWEKSIHECKKELEEYKKNLAKTNRLIEILKSKIDDSKGTD